MLLDSDRTRLRHMLEAAHEAISFAEGRTFTDFQNDRQFQLALIRDIEVIGEAASCVSEEYRKNCSQLPWALMVNTRHRLIHAYFDVDLEIVWRTVTEELPDLIAKLEIVLG